MSLFTSFENSVGLSTLEDRIPVHGCVWSKFEVIDKYERIIKIDE
jgi:hypothetical protein